MWMALLALAQAATGPQLTGDFDRDGVDDRAYFVSAPGRVDLIMQSGVSDAAPMTMLSMDDPGDRRFWVARPGRYRTACPAIAGDGGEPCRAERIVLTGPTVAYGIQGDEMTALIWNGTGFDAVDLIR